MILSYLLHTQGGMLVIHHCYTLREAYWAYTHLQTPLGRHTGIYHPMYTLREAYWAIHPMYTP